MRDYDTVFDKLFMKKRFCIIVDEIELLPGRE